MQQLTPQDHAEASVYLDFMIRYATDRPGFVRNVLKAEPDVWQEAVLSAMDRGERKISVRSGHGVGKSALEAWIAVHAVSCFPLAKVIETAPSGTQLFDVLFSETKMWLNRLPEAIRQLFDPQKDRIEAKAAPEQIFVSARTSRAETPEAMAGVHAEGGIVVLLCDEASGIPEPVYEAGAGSMSGHNTFTLLMGNPTRLTGLFFDTHHRLKDKWFTLRVSSKDSKRVSAAFIQEIIDTYGENSNAYRVRVLGEFPIRDDSTYISLDLVTRAKTRDIALDKGAKKVWGLDCARFGNDKSVLTKRFGTVVPERPKVWKGFDTMQVVGAVMAEWDETPEDERPDEINVDVIGIGAGVVDRLAELGVPVRGINVAESPSFDPRNKFNRLRDQLWYLGKQWFEAADCKVPDDECFDELAMPKYTFQSNGELKVEPKPDFKKRLGFSPDFADSFLLTLATGVISLLGGGGGKRKKGALKRNIKGVV